MERLFREGQAEIGRGLSAAVSRAKDLDKGESSVSESRRSQVVRKSAFIRMQNILINLTDFI
jgi:hypothetical protein